jgi:hypothetical protein
MVILLTRKITPEEFKQATEIYNDYIKTVIDIDSNTMAVGSEFHIDCEEITHMK